MTKGGTDTKNIYLNALSIRPDGLDLIVAEGESSKFPEQWIAALTSPEPASMNMTAHTFSASKLRHLYFESKNIERIQGASTLGFGFPLFQQSSEDELIVAPVIIWKIKLEYLQDKADKWLIQQPPSKSFFLNPFLKEYLFEKYELDISEIFESLLGEEMTQERFQKFVSTLKEKLQIEANDADESIIPGPGVSELAASDHDPVLRNSGYFGIFPPVVSTDDQGADVWWRTIFQHPTATEIKSDKHDFSFLPGDPWQESAFQETLARHVHLITGAPGTGKSKTCLNILLNALSNGQKCLVVSSRLSALLNLQHQLSATVEGPLHFLFKDPENEKQLLLEMLKASVNSEARTSYDESRWRLLATKCQRDKKRLDENYRAVTKKIFGTYNWAETVGLFLKNNKTEGKELLSSQLKTQDFSFTFDEYISLEDGILHCKKLYDRVKTLQHPLQNLHPSIFKSINKIESFDFVKNHLTDFKNKAQELHLEYISTIDNYHSRLSEFYEKQHQQFLSLYDEVKFFKEDAESQFGKDFSESSFDWVELKSIFSKRSKSVIQLKKELKRRFENLKEFYEKNALFESKIAGQADGKKVKEVSRALSEFKENLDGWRQQLPAIIQDEMIRLNTKSTNKNLDFKETITFLESRMDYLIVEINESGLLNNTLENKMLTIPKRQQYLEEIIQQLEQLDLNMRDFDNFHDWQSYWLTVPELGQKVVKSLVKVKSENWQSAFESWYFHNCLLKNQSPDLPQNDEPLFEFVENYQELLKFMPLQIRHLWEKRKEKALSEIRKKNKALYQYFEGKTPKNFFAAPLRKNFENAGEYLTDILPVWFCTPEAVAHTFAPDQKIFDWVIVEEAGMISPAEAVLAAQIGKQVLIAGDTGPHTSEGALTLLELAYENRVPKIHLATKYSTNPEALHRFNIAAFQWQEEPVLDTQQEHPGVFSVEKLIGRFDEKDGVNEAEAHFILKYLNKIQQTPQRTFPSVAIACFTPQQRDLISNYLMEIKQKNAPGSDVIRQLERNGMGVFYIGNMRAEHFDILLVSTTFGAVNTSGKMTRWIDKLNSESGLQKIYTLTSCPRKELVLVHSLPEDFLDSKIRQTDERGLYLLANFVRYMELTGSKNQTESEKILRAIQLKDVLQLAPKTSVFMTEVASELTAYFEESSILKNCKIEDLTLPVCIGAGTKNQPVAALEADGFLAKSPHTSYLWEYQQRKKIENAGCKFIPAWSVEWWKNADKQAKKIASQIVSSESGASESGSEEH